MYEEDLALNILTYNGWYAKKRNQTIHMFHSFY